MPILKILILKSTVCIGPNSGGACPVNDAYIADGMSYCGIDSSSAPIRYLAFVVCSVDRVYSSAAAAVAPATDEWLRLNL